MNEFHKKSVKILWKTHHLDGKLLFSGLALGECPFLTTSFTISRWMTVSKQKGWRMFSHRENASAWRHGEGQEHRAFTISRCHWGSMKDANPFLYSRIERGGRRKNLQYMPQTIPADSRIAWLRLKNHSAENGKSFGGHFFGRFTSLGAYLLLPNPRYSNPSPDDRMYRASVRSYTCFRKVPLLPRKLGNCSRNFQTAEPDNCRYTP